MRTTKTVSVWPVGIGKFKVLALLVENPNAISTDYDGKTYTPIQIAKGAVHKGRPPFFEIFAPPPPPMSPKVTF